jgi:hypothetical protein
VSETFEHASYEDVMILINNEVWLLSLREKERWYCSGSGKSRARDFPNLGADFDNSWKEVLCIDIWISHTVAMASTRTCLSQLTPTTLSRPNLYVPSISIQQRGAAQSANAQKYKRKELPTSQRKKKSRTTFINHDLKDAIQFPLVDAMRYEPLLVIHHSHFSYIRSIP